MAEIQPFRAYRYDLGRVGALSSVIAPPYDVIDDALRATLANRHPNNVVNVDLPRPEPGDADANACYARAGRRLKDWVNDGIVKQDSARALSVYHQEFEHDGARHTRRGFLARVRLQPASEGSIRPHEETFSGPKMDRLRLMHATAMNLSPVFGLYADDRREVQELLDAAVARQPPQEATDDLGVVGRMWPVMDQQVISKVVGLIGPRPVLIADGHHRYETSLQYRNEILGAAADQPGDEPVRYTLMNFVGMSDPGLLVLPTHRLVNGLQVTAADLGDLLGRHFDVRLVGRGDNAAQDTWVGLADDSAQGSLGFGLRDGAWVLAKPRDLSAMKDAAPERSDEWRGLSVSVLHRLVLERLLKPAAAGFTFDYVHRLDEVTAALAGGRWDVGVLVPPVSVAATARIADGGERMPQKSTYFYPKLQTGFVFNPLAGN